MAIQINQPDLSGLANAGRGSSNLNLPVPGALGLQALAQLQNQRAQQQQNALGQAQLMQQAVAQRNNQDIARQQMNQQGLLSNQDNATKQQDMAQRAAQFAGTADFQNRELAQREALGQGELDARAAETGQRKMAEQMKALLDMDTKKLKETGAFAAYGLMSMQGTKTPEEASMLRNEILKEAVAKGHRTKEEAAALSKMPISQFKAALAQGVIASGQAAEYQAANKALNPKEMSGMQAGIDENGNPYIHMDANTAVKSEVQKKVISNEKLQSTFNEIEKGYNPDYFRYGNKMDNAVSNAADRLKDTALGGIASAAASAFTGKTPEQRDAFVTKRTSFMNNVNQVFNQYRKEITGAAAAIQELDRLQASFLSGEMAPSEFRGALDLVKSKGLAELEQDKKTLREGVNMSPSVGNDTRQRLEATGKYSKEQIDEYLRGN